MEGIYLVQHYGSTSAGLHSGFIVGGTSGRGRLVERGMVGGRYLVYQSFTDCTLSVIREHARALLGRDDEEIPVFEARVRTTCCGEEEGCAACRPPHFS